MKIRIQFADGLEKIQELNPQSDGKGGHYFPMTISAYHPGRRAIVQVYCEPIVFKYYVCDDRSPIFKEKDQGKKVVG